MDTYGDSDDVSNFKSINFRQNCYSPQFQKNHGENLLFPLQRDFVKFFFAITQT
jgi:hypothetical protein